VHADGVPKEVTMGFSFVRRCAPVLGAAMLGLMLTACGGGGGGGDDDGGNPPPPPPVGLEGRLWHTNYALDFLDGTQIASAEGDMPQAVTNDLPAWPWADGSQYATADWDTSDDETTVTLSATGSNAVLHRIVFEGYLRGIKPSPVSKDVILATWGEDSVSPAVYVFYNMATRTVLDVFDVDEASLNWLPDGRYIRITDNGAISTGTVGGSRQAAGSFAVPGGGWAVNNVWVNPQGTQMVLQLWIKLNTGTIDRSDLWVANLDGSAAGRLTNTGLTSYGKWSPDGAHVAFDVDTGLTCGGGGCAGSCGLWYAESTARAVLALPSSGDAEKFTVKNSRGEERSLGCELLAWTD
jgi:hypothetical protein